MHSHLDHAYEGDRLGGTEERRTAMLWCAPSFEEFAHRFRIGNRLWSAVTVGDPSGLDPLLRDYPEHYAPPAPEA
ncbi:hypothetical protein [Streptomyces sp. NPDC058613]|uniref:hypothetical protein n=1 Tax=Streptomyces sp. NPDC058613 TaxID=3346556 RepID=UPI00364F06C0